MNSVDTSFKWALYARLAQLRTELRAREIQRPSIPGGINTNENCETPLRIRLPLCRRSVRLSP